MIKGNSAVNFEGEKQNTTPFIKVELKQNSIGVSLNPVGASSPEINYRTRSSRSVRYKAGWLLANGPIGSRISYIEKVDDFTYDKVGEFDPVALASDVAVNGTTAVAFDATNPGTIRRTTSFGGTVWGVSTLETVYIGASQPLRVYALAATSPNRVYFIEHGTTIGDIEAIRGVLKCSEKIGTTWFTQSLDRKSVV